MLGLPEAAQSRSQRARASINSDARAQKASTSRLELSEVAQPRVQQAKESIYRCLSTESESISTIITEGCSAKGATSYSEHL